MTKAVEKEMTAKAKTLGAVALIFLTLALASVDSEVIRTRVTLRRVGWHV